MNSPNSITKSEMNQLKKDAYMKTWLTSAEGKAYKSRQVQVRKLRRLKVLEDKKDRKARGVKLLTAHAEWILTEKGEDKNDLYNDCRLKKISDIRRVTMYLMQTTLGMSAAATAAVFNQSTTSAQNAKIDIGDYLLFGDKIITPLHTLLQIYKQENGR